VRFTLTRAHMSTFFTLLQQLSEEHQRIVAGLNAEIEQLRHRLEVAQEAGACSSTEGGPSSMQPASQASSSNPQGQRDGKNPVNGDAMNTNSDGQRDGKNPVNGDAMNTNSDGSANVGQSDSQVSNAHRGGWIALPVQPASTAGPAVPVLPVKQAQLLKRVDSKGFVKSQSIEAPADHHSETASGRRPLGEATRSAQDNEDSSPGTHRQQQWAEHAKLSFSSEAPSQQGSDREIIKGYNAVSQDTLTLVSAAGQMSKDTRTEKAEARGGSRGYMSTEHLLRNLISNEVLSSDFRNNMGKLYKGLHSRAPGPERSPTSSGPADITSSAPLLQPSLDDRSDARGDPIVSQPENS